ncbi:MAG: Rrf2 family transcriptional regulator [Peptostreptococcus porci]|uniref:Rrf2 family transcriptional regulator n=1 Tax=Peptostreptococcus porci TaxID=2652282 RepID=UPI002A74CD35|nr:Rrf2 family transcriptional regulator [Peptostreptococcus porci]MDY2795031.1 Rrf2 family transcriptional regulator [Peptostreptococcus porci]MDY5480362.1 Rrf2 family transcriptional regulator [Peptostreptococcus porci]
MDTKFSIAIHILVYINETEKIVTSELLAKSVGTNASHIRKIISLLKDANIVDSQQGKKGMVLKIKASKLTLDKVYFAVYPEKEILHVHNTSNQECPIGLGIKEVLLPIFEESEKQLILNLKNKTLESLIRDLYKTYNEQLKRGVKYESSTSRTIQ